MTDSLVLWKDVCSARKKEALGTDNNNNPSICSLAGLGTTLAAAKRIQANLYLDPSLADLFNVYNYGITCAFLGVWVVVVVMAAVVFLWYLWWLF